MASKLSPVTIVLRGVDKVTGTVNKISARLNAMNRPVRNLSRAFSDLSRNSGISKVATAVQGVGTSLARLARNALFAGSALAVMAATGMQRFISRADALDEAAQAAGISVERLQEVRFAAGRSGIGEGQIDQMMRKFSRSLGEVRRGTGALTGVLKKSNPELLKQFRAVQSTDEGLDLLMRTLRKIPNQALRNVLAVAAVGKGGERITLLADSYDELIQKARDLGIVMSRETVAKAVQAQDSLEDLGHVASGLGYSVASELLPSVIEIVGRITAWVEQNRELIRTELPKFVARVVDEVRQIAGWLSVAVPKVVSFVEQIGGLKTVLAALAVVILGPVVSSLFALSAALLTTPFGWVILGLTAIAATIAAIVANWDWLMEKFNSTPGWIRVLAGALPGVGALLNAGGSVLDLARTATTDVGGKLDINITGAPAQVTNLKANGPMTLDVGTAMAGAW